MTAKLLLGAILLCAIVRIAAAWMSISLLAPDPLQVVYVDELYFEVAVELDEAFPAYTFVCIVEYTTDTDTVESLARGKDQCIASNSIYVDGVFSGTHLFLVYLEGFADESSYTARKGTILSSTTVLIDTVDVGTVHSFMVRGNAAVRMMGDSSLSRFDYLLLPNREGAAHWVLDTASRIEMPNLDNAHTTHDRDAQSNHSHSYSSGPILLAVFVADLSALYHSSSRLQDWLCDPSMHSNGVVLSVLTGYAKDKLTGTTDSNEPTDGAESGSTDSGSTFTEFCQVPIYRFHCLDQHDTDTDTGNTDKDEGTYNTDTTGDKAGLLQRLSLLDAVLMTNTLGDESSTLLLNAVHSLGHGKHKYDNLHDKDSKYEQYDKYDKQDGKHDKRGRHGPLVLMDLPNIQIPHKWGGLVDAFIAPSRAVGLMDFNLAHGKPIAVIHPPLRDLVVASSPCSSLNPENRGATEAGSGAATDMGVGIDADTETLSWPRAEASDPDGTFTFLYVGRLSPVKCPGLLVRALAYILHSGASGLSAVELDDFRRRGRVKFVGGGLLEDGLRQLARRLQLDMVSFTGAVGAEEVVGAMRSADVLVNPIVRGETFGFVHIEAAAHALPVIAFNTGANRESVLSGLLVEYRNGTVVEDLAAAMVQVYRQRTMPMFSVEEMCAAAVPMFERWSTQRHSRGLVLAVRGIIAMQEAAPLSVVERAAGATVAVGATPGAGTAEAIHLAGPLIDWKLTLNGNLEADFVVEEGKRASSSPQQ